MGFGIVNLDRIFMGISEQSSGLILQGKNPDLLDNGFECRELLRDTGVRGCGDKMYVKFLLQKLSG
jgi:hypothetical protein